MFLNDHIDKVMRGDELENQTPLFDPMQYVHNAMKGVANRSWAMDIARQAVDDKNLGHARAMVAYARDFNRSIVFNLKYARRCYGERK